MKLRERVISLTCPFLRPVGNVETGFRVAVWLAVVCYSIRYFDIPVFQLGFDPGFMHGVHLIIHEAGHFITGVLTSNRIAVVFMGSGFQVLFPFSIALAFYFKNKDSFSAAIILWWTGMSVLDVAPYIADARALNLDLLSGGTGKEVEGHDWEFLLGHWNLLQSDIRIAANVALLGRALMAIALIWGALSIVIDRWYDRADVT